MVPLCFVLMPFGIKTDGNKKEINFDLVYKNFIKPAIIKAGLEPVRADEEKEGGFIHKPMYERLLYCSFAVADLSFDNANVFYELGIRHAVKPFTTVIIFEKNTKLAFDAAPLRAFPYEFIDGAVVNQDVQADALASLIKINLDAKKAQEDSPIGQMISAYKFPDLTYLQEDADCFATQVQSTNETKDKLGAAVKKWRQLDKEKDDTIKKPGQAVCVQNVKAMETAEGHNLKFNFDLLYVLLNSYKSMNAFAEIVSILEPYVINSANENIYLGQQLALAYNKTKQRDDAEKLLLGITNKYGADPETNGLLGAVYKGMMDDNSNAALKQVCLKNAVEAYLAGFEADPRDYYPGINALTLMFLSKETDPRFTKFMPLVTYAAERQLRTKNKDYWAQATALELAVLDLNAEKANQYLAAALFCNPDKWMRESTAGNIQKVYNKAAETKSKEDLAWLQEIITGLN
ncbi:MAG: TRAFs-binding domain-containing protein [Bacteroidota bacterium]